MSNLATITLEPNVEYQNLASLASITFTEDTTYTLQIEGDVMICEKSTKPTSGGFHIIDPKPFDFTAGTDALWVKNLRQYESAIINIAD